MITDVATGAARSFPVVPRERHALAGSCDVSWRGNHFLEFSPERTGFIDVESLKLSFPFPEGSEVEALNYDAGFNWAVVERDAKLAIARVSVR